MGASQRQAGNDPEQINFREVLDRLSNGTSTSDDWKKIMSRSISKIKNYSSEFANSIRLFPTNEYAESYNLQKLRELSSPVVTGKHNSAQASKGSSEAAQGLHRELYLSKGSRVMLRTNLWTKKGLVNGTVVDIIYRPNENPKENLPMAILIKWDSYTG